MSNPLGCDKKPFRKRTRCVTARISWANCLANKPAGKDKLKTDNRCGHSIELTSFLDDTRSSINFIRWTMLDNKSISALIFTVGSHTRQHSMAKGDIRIVMAGIEDLLISLSAQERRPIKIKARNQPYVGTSTRSPAGLRIRADYVTGIPMTDLRVSWSFGWYTAITRSIAA